MSNYEIRVLEAGLDYGTSSGPLHLTRDEALELFEAECLITDATVRLEDVSGIEPVLVKERVE